MNLTDSDNNHDQSNRTEEPLLVLVANIAEHRLWTHPNTGKKELRPGSKHYSAGTKVYCDHPLGFWQWNPEFGTIPVLGLHRGSKRWVQSNIKVRCLTNFRATYEYSPRVIELLTEIHKFWIIRNTRFGMEEFRDFADLGNRMAEESAKVIEEFRRVSLKSDSDN